MELMRLPELTIKESTVEEDIKCLMNKIKPAWNEDKIIMKRLTGGYSTLIYRVQLEDDSQDAITVRIKKLGVFLEDIGFIVPGFEFKVLEQLTKVGLFPKVYAVFENGFCYKYIKGQPIVNLAKSSGDSPDFHTIPIREMAEKLAEIHSVKLEETDYSKTEFLHKMKQMAENKFPEETAFVTKEELIREMNEMLDYTKEFNLNIGLCHGDPHPGNIVWNKKDGKLTYVDWETAHIGYQSYDVAYFIRVMHIQDIMHIPGFPKNDNKIDNSTETFIKWYFEKWCQLTEESKTFEEFHREVSFFDMVWCLMFVGLLGSIENVTGDQLSKTFPADPKLMMRGAYEHYWKIKEERLKSLNLK